MGTLSLGVLDVAYSDASSGGKETTTFAVAKILEQNYHVMATFFALRQQKIADYLTEGIAQSFADRMNGRTVGNNPLADAEQQIETEFRAFIYANEMNKISTALTGTPISAAAARGVNKRLKHPYAGKNKARPAFVDSGLYVESFRAWFNPGGTESAGARPAINIALAQQRRMKDLGL